MGQIPNSLAIFGSGPCAVSVAFRTVLKFKEFSGPVVILDYTGRGAIALGEDNKMGLLKRPVFWYDTANRQRPVALFSLRRSNHFHKVMYRVLLRLRQISGINVKDETLAWAVEAAYSLSKDGSVGLVALIKFLSSSETRCWFLNTRNDPHDLDKLLKTISWALNFPSVYAICEGINKAHIEQNLQQECVIWIESRSEYFERFEHQIIAALSEAAIEDAILSFVNAGRNHINKSHLITIVHLFPPASISSEVPEWVKETSDKARHIGVHKLHSESPLNQFHLSWAAETSNIWIVGKLINPLKKSAHKNWLQAAEIERINTLDYNELWVKSNKSRKYIVSRIRPAEESLNLAYKLRHDSGKYRKTIPVRQMASANIELVDSNGKECGLYERLCDIETLRLGWLKVKTAPKGSYGSDNITISMFKENLENELARLANELRNREYRCKPLRRIYIPKHDGGKRELGIACVRDRVAQSSCLMLLEQIFEPAFSRYSFAFRPRRNAHQALSLVRGMITTGYAWAVIADIKKCFDSIDHDVLLNLISRRIGDHDILNLIRHWLTADILDFNELLPIEIGVPQGESLSPLLANIYLDPMDKYFEQLGLYFVRFADDIIILTSSEEDAVKALQIMERFLLEPLRLELKPAKTNYVSIAEGFDFLGFRIRQDRLEIRQDRIESVLDMLRGHIKMLGHPAATLRQRADSITKVNAIVRGWRNYFAFPDEKHIEEQLKYLDGLIEQIGHQCLPVNIRDDPLWICRERFLMPGTIEDLENEEETAEREAKTGSGYPEDKNNIRPAAWMIKEKSENNNPMIRKASIVLEDSGDDADIDERVTKDSIVENGDRLYVLTHGSYLAMSKNDLIIKKRKAEIYRRPMSDLSMVFLQGFGMNISVNLQSRLAEMDVPVVFAPPFGEPIAVLNPINSSKSFLRGLQVLRRDDPDIINAGLHMIASKMGNQAAVLKYFSKYRKKTDTDIASQLTESADEISDLAGTVLMLDPGSASVRTLAMGYEGHAAAIYWQQIIKIMPEELGFSGRITKSAEDPINQCFNYIYGILYGEVWRAVAKAGLDPYFGFMHGSKRDQGSLVFDLIEEFRAPFADRLVIGMLGRGFQPEIGNHSFLKTKTKRRLAICFSNRWFKKISWRSHKLEPAAILIRQAFSLANLIKREGDYHPYKMRW